MGFRPGDAVYVAPIGEDDGFRNIGTVLKAVTEDRYLVRDDEGPAESSSADPEVYVVEAEYLSPRKKEVQG